jgi:ankyrin repeat protein
MRYHTTTNRAPRPDYFTADFNSFPHECEVNFNRRECDQDYGAMSWWGRGKHIPFDFHQGLAGDHPLHIAARAGSMDECLMLLQNGAKASDINPLYRTQALHVAATNGHAPVCSMLIEDHGADINAKTCMAFTPLYFAAFGGHAELCSVLIGYHGADVNAGCGGGATGIMGSMLITPLHVAAQNGHAKACRVLIRNGANSDAKTSMQETPLLSAARGGNTAIGRMLIDDCGVDVNVKDVEEWTAVHHAVAHGHGDFFRMLVDEYGSDAKALEKTQYTPLHLAAQEGHLKLCRMLIEEYGNNVNATANQLYTPLHCAAQRVIPLITMRGLVDPSNPSAEEEEAGKAKAEEKKRETDNTAAEICHALVEEYGADVNARTNEQVTPLHMAADSGYVAMCKSLILVGANHGALDFRHRIPATQARVMGYPDLASHLCPADTGAHYLHCTGPSLKRVIIWNDTTEAKMKELLHKMEVQWLARVAEGCHRARMGLTLRRMHGGKLPNRVLLQIMRFVVVVTDAHLGSYISTLRAQSRDVLALCALSEEVKDESGEPAEQQQQLCPRLALISHTLAHHMAAVAAKEQVRIAAVLMAAANATHSSCGCMWLHNYCNFVLQRNKDRISCRRCGASRSTGMLRCSKCRLVRYCSRQCQRADWKQHKSGCIEYARQYTGHDGTDNELLEKPRAVDARPMSLPTLHGTFLARLQQHGNLMGSALLAVALVLLVLGATAFGMDTRPSVVLAVGTPFLLFVIHHGLWGL